MLIIPEKECIFILPPRTGSGSLYRAVRENFPRSILLYRHMEADGVPFAYDRYKKYCFVRHPITRLWSLYWFLKGFKGGVVTAHEQAHIDRVKKSVDCTFEEWLLFNNQPFSCAEDLDNGSYYYPVVAQLHMIPENKKSLRYWARPDLGTILLQFEQYHKAIIDYLGVNMNPYRSNVAERKPEGPVLSSNAVKHIDKWFSWDLSLNLSPKC